MTGWTGHCTLPCRCPASVSQLPVTAPPSRAAATLQFTSPNTPLSPAGGAGRPGVMPCDESEPWWGRCSAASHGSGCHQLAIIYCWPANPQTANRLTGSLSFSLQWTKVRRSLKRASSQIIVAPSWIEGGLLFYQFCLIHAEQSELQLGRVWVG